ncbi:MAG: cyclomaltodextrinase N-terminal domain-containing protein [Acidobacteriia bacterium]|nr:cyclomaltodextrinase N-terminal domain-containing protein [Terriglobia bacterium]
MKPARIAKVGRALSPAWFLLCVSAAASAAPEVRKVEPPNWWTGHSLNPVRLLISGRDLRGATVKCAAEGVTLSRAHTNAVGTYLFVDVEVGKNAKPGSYPLEIFTPEGAAIAPFQLLGPLPREGRFQGFSPDDVIYLIMPDRFANGDLSNDDPPVSRGLHDRRKPRYYHGGDLQGILNHLPYLKDLGVTALWLNPIYENVNHLNEREKYDGQPVTDYHGYGAVDFYGVDEHFGDLATFQKLVEAAHSLGMKVIQDHVANHTGPYHPWVTDSPRPTWFNGTAQKHLANPWQTWTLMDPHATPALTRSTLEGWFIDILPDLNQNDPEVSRYLIQNTLWWIGATGIDGIRQDTLPYVPRGFWRDWSAAIKLEYPGFRVVGELFDEDPALVSFFQGGKPRFDGIDSGIDALFDFPLYGALRRVFARKAAAEDLGKVLAHDYLYPDPNRLVTFLGLHDVARFMNEPGATADELQLAFTFLMTARGIPMVYYGDEIAMRGGNDPDNRRDFPGGWRDDFRNAFEPSGRRPEEQLVFDHLRRLTRLRARLAPLRRGSMLQMAASERIYAFARVAGASAALVAFNTGAEKAALSIQTGAFRIPENASIHDELGAAPDAQARAGRLTFELPPHSAAIYYLAQ